MNLEILQTSSLGTEYEALTERVTGRKELF